VGQVVAVELLACPSVRLVVVGVATGRPFRVLLGSPLCGSMQPEHMKLTAIIVIVVVMAPINRHTLRRGNHTHMWVGCQAGV
jgi:multisubunit Na+/H+ antiporter MnhG subunit